MLLNKRIPVSYIFKLVSGYMIAAIIIAGIISYTDQFYEGWGLKFPIVPDNVPSMLGTLIALVLAFRINQSYDRWWEGRKIWGAIVNDSRAMIRELSYLTSKNFDDEAKQKAFRDEMINDLLGWLYALENKLRGENKPNEYVTGEMIAELKKSDDNIPNALLHKMQMQVQEVYNAGLINEYQQIQLTKTINVLGDSMGKCERIKGTVFPKLYSNLIDFAIWVFVIILPLSYRDPNEYVEFPVCVFFSFVFISLEKIAIALQDPFENVPTDIPMLTIIRNIEIFGRKVMGKKDSYQPLKDKGYYSM